MNKPVIQPEDYQECLAVLRVWFHKNRTKPKLQERLLHEMTRIMTTRFPDILCHITVDMADPEHPKITTVPTGRRNKAMHYDNMKAQLQKRYGKRLGLFLTNRLASMMRKRKLEAIDNLRIARVGYKSSEIAYEEARSGGCCGFADQEFRYKYDMLGVTIKRCVWKIGFNFGH